MENNIGNAPAESTPNTNLEWALAYAKAGFRVLPLHHVTDCVNPDGPLCSCGNTGACAEDRSKRGKHPHYDPNDLAHGLKDATCDSDIIIRWFTRWPEANIGVATGDGVVVVDDDKQRELRPDFPHTLSQQTGRGRQYFCRVADSTKIPGKVAALPGIDLRSDGNYVVVPPSLHWTGQRYKWQRNGVDIEDVPDFATEIKEAPAEFWDRLLNGESTKARQKDGDADHDENRRKKKTFVVPDVIEKGTRNQTITAIAGQMWSKGYSQKAVEEACLAENENRCSPPLSRNEVLRCVHSITNTKSQGELALPLNLGDDALALRYVKRYGEDIRYVGPWHKWMEWANNFWREDATYHAYDRARALVRELVVGRETTEIEKYTSAKTVAAIERLAQSDRRVAATVEQWDVDPFLLNTPGGVVDLKTGQLRPHRREDFLTKMAGATPQGDYPLFRKYLDLVTNGDIDVQGFLQRVAGYALTGSTKEQCLFFMYGPGGNGKTTFLETLAEIMGDYARTASIETFVISQSDRHPTELAWLRGARLITTEESAEGRRLNEERLKQLTGNKKITARGMRQDFFEYVPQFKLIFASNNKPRLGKVDEAWRRRMFLIPFMVNIAEVTTRDRDFPEKLKAERDGIMRWALEGCLDWQRNGLNPPNAIKAATEEYLANEDARARWIEECCELDKGNLKCFASVQMLWASWARWADINKEFPGKRNDLLQYLEDEMKLTKERRYIGKERPWGFMGIRAKDVRDDNTPF